MPRVLKNVQALYPARTWTPSIGYHHRFRWAVNDGTRLNSSRAVLFWIELSASSYLARSLARSTSRAAVVSRLSENRLPTYTSCPHPKNGPYIRWDRVLLYTASHIGELFPAASMAV